MKVKSPDQPMAPSPEDTTDTSVAAFILLGKTGAGKSSFIKLLGGKDTIDGSPPSISKGLNSCTKELTAYTTTFNNRKILLLDTPGFDDSGKENLENLLDIISSLYSFTKKDVKIHGVIFLHDISEMRLSGSQRKTFSILSSLCGEKCMGNVIVGTTMWSPENPEKFQDQEERERELHKEHWGGIYKRVQLLHGEDSSVAQTITDLLNIPPISLLVQEEMCQPPHKPENTSAVKLIMPEILQERRRLQEELDEKIRLAKEATGERKEQAEREAEAKRQEFELFNGIFERLKTPPDANFVMRLGLTILRPIVLAPLAVVSVPLGLFDAFTELFSKKKAT